MKHFRLFLATLGLTGLAFMPATALANGLDDLDVTMDVMESMENIDEVIYAMPGPEGSDAVDSDHDGDDELYEDGEEEGGPDHEASDEYESAGDFAG